MAAEAAISGYTTANQEGSMDLKRHVLGSDPGTRGTRVSGPDIQAPKSSRKFPI